MIHDTPIYSVVVTQDETSRFSRSWLTITNIYTGINLAREKLAPYQGSIGKGLEIGFIKRTTDISRNNNKEYLCISLSI